MKVGSLFSGGGLGDFGFMAAGMEITWQCEIDEYCQKILALRYPESNKYTDIKTLKGGEIEKVEIITGGFPCQPFSVAGKQKGKEDNRYLWPEMLRVIKECRPRWIVGENVPGIINLALDTVCADLEAEGYEVWPIVFPSHALGAWHKRDRLWIVAHSGCKRGRDVGVVKTRDNSPEERTANYRPSIRSSSEPSSLADTTDAGIEGMRGRKKSAIEDVPNAESAEQQRERGSPWSGWGEPRRGGWWSTEPAVGRVAHGIADRVHRLKMLGNGQVPACTYVIGKMIMDITANVVKESE